MRRRESFPVAAFSAPPPQLDTPMRDRMPLLSENRNWNYRPAPLWNPELEGFEARVAVHNAWELCRESLSSTARLVHDCYFRSSGPGAREADELLIWSIGATPGSGRIDKVRLNNGADRENARVFMRSAFSDIRRRLVSAPGRGGWNSNEREFKTKGGWFFDNIRKPSLDQFLEDFAVADERNLLFDLHIVPMSGGRSMLRFWMTHPARGYDREIIIDEARESEAEAIALLVSDHFALHRQNFAWALADTEGAETISDGHDRITSLMKKAS